VVPVVKKAGKSIAKGTIKAGMKVVKNWHLKLKPN
jgi:hypothetical protein